MMHSLAVLGMEKVEGGNGGYSKGVHSSVGTPT